MQNQTLMDVPVITFQSFIKYLSQKWPHSCERFYVYAECIDLSVGGRGLGDIVYTLGRDFQ
jgi:hypothetical protein